MLKRDAALIIGGLSDPSKMPSKSIGLPAIVSCGVGAKLALIPGTPCHDCYANNRGTYQFPVVKAAQARRLAKLKTALETPTGREAWIAAMVTLLRTMDYFRWHDSGDVISAEHLDAIVEVVRRTPQTRHWLPTQERGIVLAWMRTHGAFPENLTVRLSMTLINASADLIARTAQSTGLNVSSVQTVDASCPARFQDNECGDCRNCWDRAVLHVSYPKH